MNDPRTTAAPGPRLGAIADPPFTRLPRAWGDVVGTLRVGHQDLHLLAEPVVHQVGAEIVGRGSDAMHYPVFKWCLVTVGSRAGWVEEGPRCRVRVSSAVALHPRRRKRRRGCVWGRDLTRRRLFPDRRRDGVRRLRQGQHQSRRRERPAVGGRRGQDRRADRVGRPDRVQLTRRGARWLAHYLAPRAGRGHGLAIRLFEARAR